MHIHTGSDFIRERLRPQRVVNSMLSHTHTRTHTHAHAHTHMRMRTPIHIPCVCAYEVATISRLLKIIGLFYRVSSVL